MSPQKISFPSVALAVSLGLAGLPAATAQPAFLAADVNTEISAFGGLSTFEARVAVELGGELFFVVEESMFGRELWKTDGTDAGTVQVKDICPWECYSWPRSLTVSNGVLYFVANDGAHGDELWRTDGTEDGTWLVQDVRPGPMGGTLLPLMESGGTLFFTGDDGLSGREPWASDGTEAGTRLLRDVRPGPDGSSPLLKTAAGGRLVFAADDGVHGTEPWISDGTEAGTRLLIDLRPGMDSSTSNVSFDEWFLTPDGLVLLDATAGTGRSGLWATRGTAADTYFLSENPLLGTVWFHSFSALGPAVCFASFNRLWRTDGTPEGTFLLEETRSGPQNLVRVGDRLFFSAGASGPGGESLGRELWVSDGTAAGTQLVKDVRPGPASGLLQDSPTLLEWDGEALFLATVDVTDGSGTHPIAMIWRSDGTASGTSPAVDLGPALVQELAPDGSLPYVGPFAAAADQLYLWVYNSSRLQLWKSDGTQSGTGPLRVARLTHSDPDPLAPGRRGTRLLFAANDGFSGEEPWVISATADSARKLVETRDGDTHLPNVFPGQPLGGRTFFIANDRLWKTDGSPEGTESLDLAGVKNLSDLTLFDHALFFKGYHPVLGTALFRSDGTAEGTQLLADPHPGPPVPVFVTPNTRVILDGVIESLTPSGNTLFFAGGAEDSLRRGHVTLWQSDGTEEGTGPVPSRVACERPGSLTDAAGLLFFFASTPEAGRELWKSDGTLSGTFMPKDIRPGAEGSESGGGLIVWGQAAFFRADDGSGPELWRSDGTGFNTFPLTDVSPDPSADGPYPIAHLHRRLVFSMDDGVHGDELWATDGSPAGTLLLKDLNPGPGSSWPSSFISLGARFVFSAEDGDHGRELWQTDGTEAGTFLIQDLAPGPASGHPHGFVTAGPFLYFSADDGVSGWELWAVPRAAIGPTFADVSAAHWASPWIESLVYAELTAGCGFSDFCPGELVTRAEGAVFLVQASHGVESAPPAATGSLFLDVPASHPAADWIEQLAADGVTAGCGGGRFCPGRALTREEAAVLLLRARHGPAFVPPPATGTVFADVPAGHWAASWIERLAAEGLTGGCSPGLFCPGRVVTRAEMAVFLVGAFELVSGGFPVSQNETPASRGKIL